MAKKTKWRKLLAITLAASMVLGLANMSSLVAAAAGGDDSAVQTVTEIQEAYTITPETENPNDVLKQAASEGEAALIQEGTYDTNLTVKDMTLYVQGAVQLNGGLSLTNAVLEGYSSDRTADIMTVTESGSATTVNGATVKNITVTITGAVHNYLVYWQSGNFALENAVFSADNNTAGCGLYAGSGTSGYEFTAENSDVSFSGNVQGNGGSGIWANSDGNQNAVFRFTNSNLKLNNNGLNGFMGQPAPLLGGTVPHPTFVFTNTNVEATGNGSPTDGGEGDGFSYGYITLQNTDGGTYTFNVSNNDNNGIDGGRGNNAALDAQGYQIIANGNGGYGLHISKVNEGQTVSTLENCVVEANGNGKDGIYVGQPMNVINTSVTASDNDGAGFKFSSYKKDLVFDSASSLTVTGNQGSGFYLSSGIADLQESAVTATGNASSSYGGGVYNNGTLSLPADAVIYNNHATKAADDIYCGSSAVITLGAVGSDWILDDCDDAIDGWYIDQTDARWSAHAKPVYAQEFTDYTVGALTGSLALKAAHGLTPLEPDDPDLPTWTTSKSKEATELDENYESDITLSLPASEEQLTSDVVFVLDKSTSAEVEKQMTDMLQDLCAQAEETGASIKVGVVIFNKEAHNVLPLTVLNSENMAAIEAAIQTDISSGTNTHAGLLAGKAMLDADTSVEASRKYMVFVSDGLTYMFDEDANAINSIQAAVGENGVMAGNDCWGIRHYQEGGDQFIPDSWTSYLSDVGAHLSDVDTYIQPYDGRDNSLYIPKGNTTLPTTVDVALYKTSEVYRAMQEEGYHCYALTAETEAASAYPWGPSFMNYLSGGEEVSFTQIQNDIYYLLSAGSKVVDVMGFGFDNADNIYNFDFVDDPERLTLTVGGVELEKTALVDPQYDHPNATSAYGFGTLEDENDQYDYVLYYYANGEDGQSEECIIWDINVPVSNFAPVQLTYTVKLMNPQTEPGEYGVYDADGSANENGLWTNLSATLYPVDSNGEAGLPENFRKPSVAYTVKDDSGDIENPDEPDINNPDDPQEGGETSDPNAPGGQDGDDTGNSGGEEDITDSDTPTTNSPNTGDTSVLCTVCAILMLAAFAGIVVMKRKCREE